MKKTLLALTLLSVSPQHCFAGAENIFDQYSQGSSGRYENARSTTFYGGSFTGRINQNPIDLLGFQSPSISAGCGGIDMYAGSFSLISGDEVVQMLRGVAQGVPSYFFQLALSSICTQCEQLMSEINETISELNQWGKLSCEQAGDALLNATDPNGELRAAALSALPASDALQGFSDSVMSFRDGRNFGTSGFIQGLNASEESVKDLVSGNILAQLLSEASSFEYKYVDGDELTRKVKFIELISSLNGRVYIQKLDSDCVDTASEANGNADATCVKTEKKMPLLTMKLLFKGEEEASKLTYFKCVGSGSTLLEKCSEMTDETYASTTNEFKERAGIIASVRKLIDNNNSSSPTGLGIVQRLRFKENFSASQVKLMEMARYNFVNIARSKSGERDVKIEYVIADAEIRIVEDFFNETKLIIDKLATVASRTKSKIDNVMIDEISDNLKSEYLNYRIQLLKERDSAIEKLKVVLAAQSSGNTNKS